MASRVMQELSALIFLRQQMSADTHVVHAHPVIPEMARNVQVGLIKVCLLCVDPLRLYAHKVSVDQL